MAVGEYSLRLQNGIRGGFAPPTPNAVHTITQPAGSPEISIASATRPDGTPSLLNASAKRISAKDEHTASLVEELHGILKTIPVESPPGSEDIYGLDTSIAWGSFDLQWMNGGPSGCGSGISDVQPTEEEKAKFKRAVDIVYELVKKDAIQ